MNGWSRRPVALRTVSYPHHREHPAVKLGRRGTHRAAQKGAQAQRAVVVDLEYNENGAITRAFGLQTSAVTISCLPDPLVLTWMVRLGPIRGLQPSLVRRPANAPGPRCDEGSK